jgi:hypothetical protein
MGATFDQACTSLRQFGYVPAIREIIAKRIVEAAKDGERNPVRLHRLALKPFSIEPMMTPVVGAGREPRVPAFALIARVA